MTSAYAIFVLLLQAPGGYSEHWRRTDILALFAFILVSAAMLFVGGFALFRYFRQTTHPEQLIDIPEAARSPIFHPGEGYEHRDADTWGVGLFVVALILGAIWVQLIIYGLWTFENRRALQANQPQFPNLQAEQQLPPEPRLEEDPTADLARKLIYQNAILNSYGWADKNAGVVRIPIAKAMQMVAQQNLPHRDTPPPHALDFQMPGQASASGPGQPGQNPPSMLARLKSATPQ
jgi:hypothetical protein